MHGLERFYASMERLCPALILNIGTVLKRSAKRASLSALKKVNLLDLDEIRSRLLLQNLCHHRLHLFGRSPPAPSPKGCVLWLATLFKLLFLATNKYNLIEIPILISGSAAGG